MSQSNPLTDNAMPPTESLIAGGNAPPIAGREGRYRQFFDDASDILYAHDLAGNFTDFNRAGELATGYSRDEARQLNIAQLVTPECLETARAAISCKVAGQGGTVYELEMVAKDGRLIPIEVSTRLIYDDAGRPCEVQGIARDISERRRTAEALRESEERYRGLFDDDLTGNFISTPDGRLLACNKAFTRTFGFASVEEALACSLMSIYPNAEGRRELVERVRRERKIENLESELRRVDDGKPVYAIENVVGTFDERGELSELRGYVFDDTRRKLLEDQLRQSQKIEAVGQLAGGVAHDFNNLLTTIVGNTQLALRALPESSPARRRLEQIEDAAGRAAVLTRQLLAFSRRQTLDRRRLDLNDAVADIMKMLRRVIGEDVEVRVHSAPHLCPVFADPGQIGQIVLNLAVNARDAMPGGGQLVIETRSVTLDDAYCRAHDATKPGHYALLMVSDTGKGMNAETRKHIFEPFFTTKEVGKGTGLGLSMVYGIVKQHGGQIEVYSEPGHGTTFKIYLPAFTPAVERKGHEMSLTAESAALPEAVEETSGGGHETILVAEDEAPLRALAQDVLEGLGYRVILAADGAEAVETFAGRPGEIDLVMLDVVMPRMGGREAYEQITRLRPDVPTLFMTGYSTEMVQGRFIREARVPLLQKPYGLEDLAGKVRETLDAGGQRVEDRG
ncbi:MAG: PAS domain S-box protein [Pyrinomonadaceae bacterium]